MVIDIKRMTKQSTVPHVEGQPTPCPSSSNVEVFSASKEPSVPSKKTHQRRQRATPEYKAGGVAITENGIIKKIVKISNESPTHNHANAQI